MERTKPKLTPRPATWCCSTGRDGGDEGEQGERQQQIHGERHSFHPLKWVRARRYPLCRRASATVAEKVAVTLHPSAALALHSPALHREALDAAEHQVLHQQADQHHHGQAGEYLVGVQLVAVLENVPAEPALAAARRRTPVPRRSACARRRPSRSSARRESTAAPPAPGSAGRSAGHAGRSCALPCAGSPRHRGNRHRCSAPAPRAPNAPARRSGCSGPGRTRAAPAAAARSPAAG